jgi:predicted TPR repeat methyltransferase
MEDIMAMEESHRRVQWVYGSASNQELEERYDQWATEYDKDLSEDFAWNAPDNAARVLAGLVASDATILDAGAGTGLAGERLAFAGFTNMAAMDISQGMLDVAESKNVYNAFHQMVMGETLGFASDEFDAVISVGVFTLGHAPIHSFDELVRVTKPGGYIVFSLRTDMVEDGYQDYFSKLEAAGQWKLAQVTDPFQPMPKGEPEVFHQIWAYQVA